MKSVSKNELVKQISICGQLIEKKSQHLQKINVDEEKLVCCLSSEEQQTLTELLSKLQSYWIEAHKNSKK